MCVCVCVCYVILLSRTVFSDVYHTPPRCAVLRSLSITMYHIYIYVCLHVLRSYILATIHC